MSLDTWHCPSNKGWLLESHYIYWTELRHSLLRLQWDESYFLTDLDMLVRDLSRPAVKHVKAVSSRYARTRCLVPCLAEDDAAAGFRIWE